MQTVNNDTIKNGELHEVIAEAAWICQSCNLTEICSESVLRAILDNADLTANEALVKAGINVTALKRVITKRLKAKGGITRPESITISTAVEGLLVLNRMERACNSSSLHLLCTIIKTDNTAAARLLKSQQIGLTSKNVLIYKPNLN